MKIKEIRKAAEMTQAAFAEYIGVNKSTVEKWEYGNPKCPDYIRALIEYKLKTEEIIMETIKIYKITQTDGIYLGEEGTRFSLAPFGEGTDLIKGYDNGGEEYILPAGYYLGEDITGMPQIYTDHHDHCPLITYNNTPALIDATKPENKSRIFLKKAK